MAGKAAQEDTMASDRKMSANKKPVLVNIGSVLSNNLKLVTFYPIGELITHDQNLTLRYRISKSFNPKSGDWIGLFQVSRSCSDMYLYMGFHWAQKHPYDKKKPLERLLHFRINEFSIPVNCEKDTYYQFIYMTGSEKLTGCSNVFGIRIYSPLVRKPNATSKTTSEATQPSIACQQQKALVPYEFFHQQHALPQTENVVIHLCYEDLVARHCVIDPTKYPVSHRFAGSQGLKDWSRLSFAALSSYSPSINCIGCQQSKDIIRSLRRRIFWLRKPAKQCEIKDCIQKKTETLQKEVNQLKQRQLSLEEVLAKECWAKWNLIQRHHQMEQETMQKLKEMTTWFMEKQSNTCQNQQQYSFTSTGQHDGKDQVLINQSCKKQHGNTSPYVDTNNPSTSEMKSANKRSAEGTRNEGKNSQNLAREVQSTLKKNKVLLNHDTYSGSRIALRYLFKETAPKNKEQPSAAEIYSGSNLSLRFLFGENSPDKARKEKPSGNINCYSGSNLSLRRLFDDRFHEKVAKDQASTSNTYSGSNLALSYLFSEENNAANTNFKATDENSSCAKCSRQCKAQMLNKGRKQTVLSGTSRCKTETERMTMPKDDAEGSKRKTEKSVQINGKKLCVCFRNDKEQEEELQLNDAKAKSNPTSRDYLVEFKDNYLVKVTAQGNNSSVTQDTKSAPVSGTMPTAATLEVAKETNPVTSTCCTVARPKPVPRKKSNRSPGNNNITQATTKDAVVNNEAKKDATIQVDGLLYSGGVYWLSSDLPGQAKTTPAISSISCQTTIEVIPPTKSLTVSAVAATDGKQHTSKDLAILTTQADISRDAKSASSLGKTGINSRGKETSIASNPTITSTNGRPATNQNLVMNSEAQGTNPRPTMMGTIQSTEMTDISSTSQLTLIKDLNFISIPTSTDSAATQALHTLQKISPDATVRPVITSGPEENKKRKRCSTTGSSALSKSNKTDDSASVKPNENNKITKISCLTPGSRFCNFICIAKPCLPKSPTMPLVPNDSARSTALIQPVKPQSPPLTSHGTTSGAIQSTKSESKTLPLTSIHSTVAGSSASTQLSKVLPPPSCPILPPNQTTLQTAPQQDNYDEYPPLPSALPDLVEMKPSMGQADTSYASVTKRDKKPVRRPEAAMCALHSLAKLAKDIILKYYRSEEEMKESDAKAAILKDMSPLVQNQNTSQKKIQNKACQVNELESTQDTVDTKRHGNAEKKTADPSATPKDFMKSVPLSAIIQEPLMEENDHLSTTTEDSLATNQTPAKKEDPSKSILTAPTQQQKNSSNTHPTAAAQQDLLITDVLPTKRQEPIQIDESQTNRQDANHKVTFKTVHKDPIQKVQAPSKRQQSKNKKADLIISISTVPTTHASIKTTLAQNIPQYETSQEEAVKTDMKITTSKDSTMRDQDNATTQNPTRTGPPPDRQDPPQTGKSSAAQNCKETNQTSSNRQDTTEKNNAETNPDTTTKPEPQDYRSRFSQHLANQLQEDPSRHT